MTEAKSSIEPIFAVPFVSVMHPDPVALNAELKTYLLGLESQGETYKNRQPMVNRNGELFESHFQLFGADQAAVQALRVHCYQHLYQAIGQLNGYTVDMLKNLHVAVESWFHITRRGGYFPIHNHALHSWSGIYCVDPGQDADGDSTNGILSFINPFAMNTMFIDMAVVRMAGGYNYGPREIKLAAGQLLLFPSWLLHEVRPYTAEGARITVAFNAKFKLAGAIPDQVPAGNPTN
jgi:uncharacterized protein (TIGR02466 family)